jgi:carboxyl-terminal processing protease
VRDAFDEIENHPRLDLGLLHHSGIRHKKIFGWIFDKEFHLAGGSKNGLDIDVTEGLGPRRFHGRVVLMVNEHTASAGEMVAAFAGENKLATIVGTKTPGRLLSGGAFKVGHGCILGLPVAAYLTWQGWMLENDGINPAVPTELSREALRDGKDSRLETAIEVVTGL